MDPHSITASLLALLGACSAASRTISRIRGLRRAPALIQALSNELSDLQLSLMDFNDYLREKGEVNAEAPDTNQALSAMCLSLLDRTRSKVEEVEILVHYRILKAGGEGSLEVNRIAFLREQNRLNQLQVDLRSAKQQIAGLFSRLGLQEASKIEALVTDLSFQSSRTETSMHESFSKLIESQARIERALDQIIHAPFGLGRDLNMLRAANSKALESLSSESFKITVLRKPPSHPRAYYTDPRPLAPGFLQSYLGGLFIGYIAYPILGRRGKESFYDSRLEITVAYLFPLWFLHYALVFRVRCSLHSGLAFSISFKQIIPSDHIFLDLVEIGDIEGMTTLLSSGQVTINAEYYGTESGHLSQAIMLGNTKSVEFLLNMGADPVEESRRQPSPYKMAWDRILANVRTTQWRNKMKSLFPDPDVDELYNFSPLHKAVLRLENYHLGATATYPQSNVDVTDSDGRTPLIWAVWLGDTEAAEYLLRRGADCNRPDNRQISPLSFAAKGNKQCFDLLLKAKANINARTSQSMTPLHYAAETSVFRHRSFKIVKALVEANCEMNVQSHDGSTALDYALDRRHENVAVYLIEHGAALESRNDFGNNTLSWATRKNCHQSLKLLLQRGVDHSTNLDQYGTFMHLAAKRADAETLRLLAQGELQQRDINVKNKAGLSPLNLGLQREDVDAEWREAFVDFLKSIDKEQPRPEENENQSTDLRNDPMPGDGGGYVGDSHDSSDEQFEDAVEVQV